MRIFFSFIFFLGLLEIAQAKTDTTQIVFFLDSNIQQFRGVEWHRIAKKIPKGTYQKAILKIDLGCATYGCCAWDYTYRGFFSKKLNDTLYKDIEVARLITPYSSFMRKGRYGYDSTWSHPYLYDVTDFLPLLKNDSVFYSALTGGWDDKGKFGFKHTVTLYLIHGDTLRNSVRVLPAFQDNYRYRDSAQIDSLIQPFRFKLKGRERYAKLRTIITGHDQEGEFSPINFHIRLNGKPIYQKRLWKTDCDKNSIQPQSGTWIFSRTNWCPGEKVQEIEVSLPELYLDRENEVDIYFGKIQTESKEIHALYSVESHIITYGYKDSFDVALVDIVSPSRNPNYRMYNPSCSQIKFLVKNEGIMPVDSVLVAYSNEKGKDFQIKIPISLTSYESGIVNFFDEGLNGGYMNLRLFKNHKDPKSKYNDALSIGFPTPKFPTQKLVFEIATTNDSSTNKLHISDGGGKLIFNKEYYNNTQIYRDTVSLAEGCYHLELTDYDKNYECGDGLSFWYSSKVVGKTSGIFKIYDGKTGHLLKVFNPDFGGKINFEFRIE